MTPIHDQENGPSESARETAAQAVESPPDASELQRQRDDYYDRLLRQTAEFDNYRKRIERERQQVTESAAADLIEELLPLIDNFERALAAEPGEHGADAYRRGVELIHRQLLELLRKRGVRVLDTVGTEFDPYYHQAVATEPAAGRRDGEVVEELRRGYMLGDRLLRPAMVKVAKG
jgi:molecular chaperone GrpE